MSKAVDHYSLKQFVWLRAATGLYLIVLLLSMSPYLNELFSSSGMIEDPSFNLSYGSFPILLQSLPAFSLYLVLAILLAAAACLAVGFFAALSAVTLWFGLALFFHSNNLIAHPGLPFLGWMLLAMALIPAAPRLGTRISARQIENWQMPPLLYYGGWIILACGYTASGLHKLIYSPSWLDGSAIATVLASPIAYDTSLVSWLLSLPERCLQLLTWATLAVEILFLPLACFFLGRKYLWLAMTAIHCGIIATISFPELSAAVLLFHCFVFDRRFFSLWAERLLLRGMQEQFLGRWRELALAICVGLFWSTAFLWLPPLVVALIGIAASLAFCRLLLLTSITYTEIFFLALSGHLLAFHWVGPTFSRYSGVSQLSGAAILIAMSAYSALQFVALLFVFRRLNFGVLKSTALALPLAWLALEAFFYRPLPWVHGHTQLGNLYLAQLADLAGPMGISFVLFWASALLLSYIQSRNKLQLVLLALLVLGTAAYGQNRIGEIDIATASSPKLKVGIIQGDTPASRNPSDDLALAEARDYLGRSHELYLKQKPALIVWPESAYGVAQFSGTKEIKPNLKTDGPAIDVPTLFGGKSIVSIGSDAFGHSNTAYLLAPSGEILDEYSKSLPFPFGEALPLEDRFVFLKSFSSALAFTFVANESPRNVALPRSIAAEAEIQIIPAICFESLSPTHVAALSGSTPEIIVELSNHNWFAHSIVSYQHHLLSAWRAIENRRYMLRVSNAGVSTIIDPLGRLVLSTEPFAPAEAAMNVSALSLRSPYSAYGRKPLDCMAALVLVLAALCTFISALRGEFCPEAAANSEK